MTNNGIIAGRFTIIGLHGFLQTADKNNGAAYWSFASMSGLLERCAAAGVRCVLPSAMFVCDWARRDTSHLLELIRVEASSGPVVLAGFSDGATMAVRMALTTAPIAAVVCHSGLRPGRRAGVPGMPSLWIVSTADTECRTRATLEMASEAAKVGKRAELYRQTDGPMAGVPEALAGHWWAPATSDYVLRWAENNVVPATVQTYTTERSIG